MITLAAASQKGGVAKATTNLAIGAKLVEDGARVLYIDLDPQMNLSTTLKAQTGGVLSSLDVLTGEAGVAAAAQTIDGYDACLLYTSPSPRDSTSSRMPSSA